ncbi:cob(I)yrinic acid a,c-diamide adenosyltransferase [Algoriphagus sp. NBT04N3]|jgi:cob(I)alamin adenosyltransferase|uniref:cob(I)yrinic acid a,c-diamide adenosyltransferase n=1 Tax=Algoriphagus sp. NBT04N3 TaxID=2705473 RepID=UPI001C6359AE|nr:cob(I)yrinic acid a,c-diamide adenosyltransferase [Algoriphagus sp. NBT04N3]QYH38816.1 cob(I)yrinic acid a,c-diamide adenosyltransferase [Algoriphagus sp. NBT04N3]
MKIYTKTGDQGITSLLGGVRVPKSDLRIDAYGTIDELNSYVGLLRDQEVNNSRSDILKEIQDRLFTIGADLATVPGKDKVKKPDLHAEDIQMLEHQMDSMEADLPPLTAFILPGGHQSVSFCHLARTVCRRAERLAVELASYEQVNEMVIQYLNRLSDYFFVLGRKMAQELDVEEVTWKPRV